MSKIKMMDTEPVIPDSSVTEKLTAVVTDYINNTLLAIENDDERFAQWKTLREGIINRNVHLSPTTWSFLLDDRKIGPSIRKENPSAEKNILWGLRDKNGIPIRYNRMKLRDEQFIEGRGWLTVKKIGKTVVEESSSDPFDAARAVLGNN